MASRGIKDQVAIVGMGCTNFGEHWDKGADDLLVDAAKIAQDEGLEVAHAGFASARSFQTICEVMVSRSSSNLSTKRTPLKAVPSSQVPDRVP